MGLYDGFGEGISLGGLTEAETISKKFNPAKAAKLQGKAFKQGFKAAGNKQANVNTSGYTAGAVSRKLTPVAVTGGLVGAGAEGQKRLSSHKQKQTESELWKSDNTSAFGVEHTIEKGLGSAIGRGAEKAMNWAAGAPTAARSHGGRLTTISRPGGKVLKPSKKFVGRTAGQPNLNSKVGGGLRGTGPKPATSYKPTRYQGA